MMGCLGMLNGALKYGRSNYRETGAKASEYVSALERHLKSWFEGEDCDPVDGVPHLAGVLACVAIIVDAQAAGVLVDDRMFVGGFVELRDKLTPHVKRLKDLHKDQAPRHFTIADSDVRCILGKRFPKS